MFAPPLLWSAVLIAAIFFLWFGAGLIANKLAPSRDVALAQISPSTTDLLPTIVAFIGLVILVSTLPDLLAYIVRWVEMGWKFSLHSIAKLVILLITGVVFIKYKQVIARFLNP